MRTSRQTDEKLENIGRELLAAGALRESEIDRIAARDDLFAGVLAKVKSAQNAPVAEPFNFARFVRRHELGIGASVAAVLCVGVLGLYLLQKPPAVAATGNHVPAVQTGPARPAAVAPASNASAIAPNDAQYGAEDREVDEPIAPTPERAIYRQPRNAAQPRPQTASARAEAEKEFYPVTYTGDGAETVRGGRVIRVDLSRSTLFAMGMNVPLENESPTVKADLLIGPDGVTRAIRLVD